jgi:hypothetical protein
MGCGFRNAVRNELTLSDVTKVNSSVDRGVALSEPDRTTFFNILAGGGPVATDAFGTVVTQEAGKVGKSNVTSQFLDHLNVRWKPGSYLSVGGWMSVPLSWIWRFRGSFSRVLRNSVDLSLQGRSEVANSQLYSLRIVGR